ncbi:HAMP domain-containing histidine kinase [Ancylothrix sp. C2]|uniref:sensor histidine kinase n=1 Tax=Ancylothrix sp. D3o TaxID=2953691 RepID=UPI0021BB7234|nr:HAMP domain-containing sensor histidine kinase [Ancylothrix sp. D3o]MCT7950565.1 HAMP domain-containing histidine kinase [Ancylothrix sp. D3o]
MNTDFSQQQKYSPSNSPSNYDLINDDSLNQLCHELRTPLASMKMWLVFLEAALEQEDLFDAKTCERLPVLDKLIFYLENLKQHCDDQLNLINNWLELQRLENGTEPLMLSEIKLQNWIPYMLEVWKVQGNSQRQRFQTKIKEALPTFVSDVSYLERILTELLKHACKSSSPNAEITISASENKGKISLKVSYSRFQERGFNKIYPFPKQTKIGNESASVFPLAKKLANYIGGSISVINNLDNTCLMVEVPIKM